MRYVAPDDYSSFRCLADRCPDTCCRGWQISIDLKSLKKYRKMPGPIGNRVRNSIDWRTRSFLQTEDGCAMLGDEGLCDLQLEAGEAALCDTCRRYPRHEEEYDHVRELSLSLSCPAAAKRILWRETPMSFVEWETDEEDDFEEFDQVLFEQLRGLRRTMTEIAQNRELALEERLRRIYVLGKTSQAFLEAGCPERIGESGIGEPGIREPGIREPRIGEQRIGASGIGEPGIRAPRIGEQRIREPRIGASRRGEPKVLAENELSPDRGDFSAEELPDNIFNECISRLQELILLDERWESMVNQTREMLGSWKAVEDQTREMLGSWKAVEDHTREMLDSRDLVTDHTREMLECREGEVRLRVREWMTRYATAGEQMLVQFLYVYLCGAVYDRQIAAKSTLAVFAVTTAFLVGVGNAPAGSLVGEGNAPADSLVGVGNIPAGSLVDTGNIPAGSLVGAGNISAGSLVDTGNIPADPAAGEGNSLADPRQKEKDLLTEAVWRLARSIEHNDENLERLEAAFR